MSGSVSVRMFAWTSVLTVLVLPYLHVAFAKDTEKTPFVKDQSHVGWHERQLVSRLLDSERFPHRALTLPADSIDLPLTSRWLHAPADHECERERPDSSHQRMAQLCMERPNSGVEPI
ncbi:uncharacterized protein LOC119740279 [Patiria miniata]|uniref:Secreted protein n=1 Tax=Patiria miniata TaxID=46514 RepID=A0A914B7R6_PATMI|nr:uncharacterized protein LOC119740279 [Patiria miniata]